MPMSATILVFRQPVCRCADRSARNRGTIDPYNSAVPTRFPLGKPARHGMEPTDNRQLRGPTAYAEAVLRWECE
jgi:hypothetical protein